MRSRIVRPLSALADRISSADTVRAHAHVLLDFLTEIDMESALSTRSEALMKMGESALAEENRALWQIICNSLDTLVTVLGDAEAYNG